MKKELIALAVALAFMAFQACAEDLAELPYVKTFAIRGDSLYG